MDEQPLREAKSNIEHVKSLDEPDETREFESHGHLDVVKLDNGISVGRAIFEPGWRWSNDVKPIAGTDSCEVEHTGYCLAGEMSVRLNDGSILHIEPGSAFHIPAGHDAWVVGDEACILLDIGYGDYAKPGGKGAAKPS
jgi:hypothetical protein